MAKRTLATMLWLFALVVVFTTGTLLAYAGTVQAGKAHPAKITLNRAQAAPAPAPANKQRHERPVKVSNSAVPQTGHYSTSSKVSVPQVSEAVQRAYEQQATRPGNNGRLDNQGGPDAFGYRYVDTMGESVVFNWIELCGDPLAQNGPIGDNNVQHLTWNWNFPFFGTNYTGAWVSPNGVLSFGAADGSFQNDCIANITADVPKIYAYWDDQNAAGVGGCNNDGQGPWVRYRNFNTCFVVEWKNLQHYPSSNDRFTYEAILFPNGLIKLQYSSDFTANDNYASATVGVQNVGAGNGLQYTCNWDGQVIIPGSAVCFFPPGPCADFTVTAPGSWSGNTCRAWNDCPLRWNEDLMFAVTIPHSGTWTFSLCDPNTNFPTYLAVSTECCGGAILAESNYSGCPMGYPPILSEISCLPLDAGTYYVDVESYWGGCGAINLSVWECQPCEPPSPPGAIHENEDCHDGYVDNLDGGCNSDPPVFISIQNGDIVCGTSGIFNTNGQNFRDTDWYQISILDTSTITWSVQAEFPVVALIIRGDEGCPQGGPQNLTGATARMCSTATAVSRCNLLPGTYWLFVAPQENLATLPCGVRYTGTVTVTSCTPPPPPPNDNCENCSPMPDIPGSYTGDTRNAWQQCQLLNDPEVWHCFTLNECADVTISFCGTTPAFETGFVVLSPECPCGNLIFCDMYERFSCGDGNLTMHWYNLPAGTYYLPVIDEPDWHASGNYQVNISTNPCPVVPVNDLCENATEVSVPSSTPGWTMQATWDDAPFCVTGVEAVGVWYTVIGTGNRMTVSTCNGQNNYDTKINVYCGECGAFNCVTGNDDDCAMGGGASTVVWCTELGRRYYILVNGYDGSAGNFVLDVSDDGFPCFDFPACAPCDVPAGSNDRLEGEPTCYDGYEDTYNTGCSANPPSFAPTVQCGDTIYGTSGTFLLGDQLARDTDWLIFHVAQPETIEFGAIAEFPVQIIIMGPGPNGDCTDSVFYSTGALGNRCEAITTATPFPLFPGTYWLFLSPQEFSGVPCGAHYRAWLTCHAASCDPVMNLTTYTSPDNQHVWLNFTVPVAGAYDVWYTDQRNNDGDPNGGQDPQWTLATTLNLTAGRHNWTDPSPVTDYRNYVIVHNCNAGLVTGPVSPKR